MGRVADDESRAIEWLESLKRIEDVSLRIGSGATAPERFVQEQARALFAKALYRLVPQTTDRLLTDEALALPGHPLRTDLSDAESTQIVGRLTAHAVAWQQRHHLEDAWIVPGLLYSVVFASATQAIGHPWSGPLLLANLAVDAHYGLKTAPQTVSTNAFMAVRPIPEHELEMRPVYLDMLKRPDIEHAHGVVEDDGDFGAFDPRTESVDAAAKRLMPELETRLRRALESIAEDDRTLNGAQLPVTFRKSTGFEWLVRYQVLGESRNHIATADGVDRAQVSRQVQRTADLAGLTLRESPGGSPLKKRSNTQRVR